MTSPVIKDQVQQGKDRLVTQWTEKVVVQGLLESYMENVQTVEDIYEQLLDERSVFTAVGVQLDVIGTLVGEARLSKTDEPYRQAILNRIATNTSKGTPESIIETLLTITTDSTVAHVFEHYPANVHAFVNGSPTNATAASLNNIVPAGVNARLMFDAGVDSFIGATATRGDDLILGLENLDEMGLENLDLLGVSSVTVTPFEDRSFFPHLLETAIKNPLCGLFDGTVFNVESGNILDQSGNNIVFENSDNMAYRITEEI
jgi:hypothetical protein